MSAPARTLDTVAPGTSLAGEGGAVPPSEAAVGAEALLEELHVALEAAGEAVAVVERASRRILWCTSACRQVDAGLRTGADATAVAVLAAALGTDRTDGADGEVEASGSVEAVGSGDADTVVDERGGVWRLERLHALAARATFRFVPERPVDDYLRRYVADREKLFSVSRTVSVSEMATTLAHELNQPIGTIANILQGVHVLIAREGAVPESIAKAARTGERSDALRRRHHRPHPQLHPLAGATPDRLRER